jgi:NTE family protein
MQEYFDLICSDLMSYPVARAAAASSAVPVVLSPITLKNHNARCGYHPEWIKEALREKETSPRRYYQAVHAAPYLSPEKKRYVHLVDGGISDNLGIRIAIDRMTQVGDFWSSLKASGWEETRKVIFIVVNAETAVDKSVDLKHSPPGVFRVLSSVTSTPLSRYNFETIELMKSNFKLWAEDVRTGRCNDPEYKGDKALCDDIDFFLIDLDFDDIPDEKERVYFKSLPTSFKLSDEVVDKLREMAGRLLNQSKVWQRLLQNVR